MVMENWCAIAVWELVKEPDSRCRNVNSNNKKMKRNELSKVAWTLAKAIHDPGCPASEVIRNPWLFKEMVELMRKPQVEFIFMVGANFKTEVYSIKTNSWKMGPELPCNRHAFGLALVDREIFIVGGWEDGYVSDRVDSLTMPMAGEIDSTTEWNISVARLGEKRIDCAVGVVDGKIFVLGGWKEEDYSNAVEVLSAKRRDILSYPFSHRDHVDLSVSSSMSSERVHMGVAVIGKKIFVIGGYNLTDGYLSRVEVLDTETNKWSTLPSMKTARSMMGIAVIDDRFIWIFGGWNGSDRYLNSIEIIDVEKNEWLTSSIKLTSPRFATKAIAVDHKIFIIGGCGDLEDVAVEVLDIDEMKWTTLSSTDKTCRHHSAICF
jgi:N-acetylneuraminic acid mutarotase